MVPPNLINRESGVFILFPNRTLASHLDPMRSIIFQTFFRIFLPILLIQCGRRLIDLCEKFGLSAEGVSDQWIAYASGKKLNLNGQPIPSEHFGPFEIYLSQINSKKVLSTPKALKKVQFSRFTNQFTYQCTNPSFNLSIYQ